MIAIATIFEIVSIVFYDRQGSQDGEDDEEHPAFLLHGPWLSRRRLGCLPDFHLVICLSLSVMCLENRSESIIVASLVIPQGTC